MSDNLALKLIDGAIEYHQNANGEFIIDNDKKAEWALDKIREDRAEIKRLEMLRDTKIEEVKYIATQQCENQCQTYKNNIEHLENMLKYFFDTRDVKPTNAGNKIYKLLSGKLQLKNQQPSFTREDSKIVEWLEQNKLYEYVEVKKAPKWGELKKGSEVVDTHVVDEETGELLGKKKVVKYDGKIVDGVVVEEREPKFSVEV